MSHIKKKNTLENKINDLKKIMENDHKVIERLENFLNEKEQPRIEITKKEKVEYKGVHLIWNNDILQHWKGLGKNPNYDPSYATTYTKVFLPNMDINNPIYPSYKSSTLSITKNYEELPIGWKIFPPILKEKRIKYAKDENEHNSKVYPYIIITTTLFQDMCKEGWKISKWCNNDPVSHYSIDEKLLLTYSISEKKPPFPYHSGPEYGVKYPELGPPNCIMEKTI